VVIVGCVDLGREHVLAVIIASVDIIDPYFPESIKLLHLCAAGWNCQ